MVADEGLEKAESSPQPTTATVPSEGGSTDRDFFLSLSGCTLNPTPKNATFILGLRAMVQRFSHLATGFPNVLVQCYYNVSESYVCKII